MSERATQQQQELFADYSADREVLRELCRLLPALPSVLRYYDEFEDAVRSIRNPAALTVFDISAFGKKFSVDFARLGEECSVIFKHIFSYILAQDLAIISAVGYLSAAQHLKSRLFLSSFPLLSAGTWQARLASTCLTCILSRTSRSRPI